MTQKRKSTVTATATVAASVKALREKRGISAQKLADRCAAAGFDQLDRSVIANLESGRRRSVSIDEVLVLAHVLDVAPIHLFVPVDDTAEVQITPTTSLGASDTRQWVRGYKPAPGQDERVFATEVPDVEWRLGRVPSPPMTDEGLEALVKYVNWVRETDNGAR